MKWFEPTAKPAVVTGEAGGQAVGTLGQRPRHFLHGGRAVVVVCESRLTSSDGSRPGSTISHVPAAFASGPPGVMCSAR